MSRTVSSRPPVQQGRACSMHLFLTQHICWLGMLHREGTSVALEAAFTQAATSAMASMPQRFPSPAAFFVPDLQHGILEVLNMRRSGNCPCLSWLRTTMAIRHGPRNGQPESRFAQSARLAWPVREWMAWSAGGSRRCPGRQAAQSDAPGAWMPHLNRFRVIPWRSRRTAAARRKKPSGHGDPIRPLAAQPDQSAATGHGREAQAIERRSDAECDRGQFCCGRSGTRPTNQPYIG